MLVVGSQPVFNMHCMLPSADSIYKNQWHKTIKNFNFRLHVRILDNNLKPSLMAATHGKLALNN